MIVNRSYELNGGPAPLKDRIFDDVAQLAGGEPLRWFVSAAGPHRLRIDATECTSAAPPPATRCGPPAAPSGLAVAISLVPTGIGCAIGGYAGDAGPATALLSNAVDLLVTNPNAVNASNFIAAHDRIVYTEGYSIDLFTRGEVGLHVPRANRIGVIIEESSDTALAEVFNVINAVRAVHGVDIVDYVITDGPIGTRCTRHPSGAYVGSLDHPHVLLSAARQLLTRGATAIAVTTNVQDLPEDDYTRHFAGGHPNPTGGAEAIVSYLITRTMGVPSAHAPLLNFKEMQLSDRVVDARGAGEMISSSGLACVLIGLRRAPQLAPRPGCATAASIGVSDVLALVVPATAVGSVPVLAANRFGIPIVAVSENTTVLDVTAERLGLEGVVEVSDYLAAAGVLLALRSGISLETLRRPLVALGASAQAGLRQSLGSFG
jgi:hypothetical protein